MFCYICEFVVATGEVDAFLDAYGPEGPWVRLFRRDPAYVRTELGRDADNPHRFLTIDYWMTREACLAFKARARAELEAIDASCERYKERERYVGDFELLGAPA